MARLSYYTEAKKCKIRNRGGNMANLNNLSPVEKEKLKRIGEDPVYWARAFLRTFNPAKKKMEPWTARWYQVEMLRDKSTRKVYRCGRRIGRVLPI